MHGTRIGLPAALMAGLLLMAAMPLATVGQSAAPGASAAAPFAPHELSGPQSWLWGGLLWSAPTPGPDGNVQVVIPFGSSLVAIGSVNDADRSSAAAWRSVDGVTWERTMLDGAPGDDAGIDLVVPISSGLLAFGSAGNRCTAEGEGSQCPALPVAMWTSVDGTTWTRMPTPQAFAGAVVTGLAAGPDGVIAVGRRGFDQPRLWTSTEGTTWRAQHLARDVFTKAHFMDVASTAGGWLIVGSSGGTPPTGFAIGDPNGSRGAAWLSADGQTWQVAHVAGRGPQVELRSVYQGADGLLALGTREGGQIATVWTSTVGQRWDLGPAAPAGSYPPMPIAADGRRIIGESYVDGGLVSFSVSGDGVTWRTLSDLGATATMPRWQVGDGGPVADQAFVLPDGVLFVGQVGDAPVTWRTTVVPTDRVLPSPSPTPS